MNRIWNLSAIAFAALLGACAHQHGTMSSSVTPAQAALAAPMTKDSQKSITPDLALQRLKDGNDRFTSGNMVKRDLRNQVAVTGKGQAPYATVLSCIDSRAAPELVFDQGIGDVFAPRIAGNFVNEEILGSMEFAAKVVGSRLIVVLGHSKCGAIMGACDNVQLGNVTSLVTKLQGAVAAVPNDGKDRSSKNSEFVEKVAHSNVKLTVEEIKARSDILREMASKGEIKIVGAMLDVTTGKVTFME